MQATRTYPKRKIQMYDDLLELVKKHKVIALIKMELKISSYGLNLKVFENI